MLDVLIVGSITRDLVRVGKGPTVPMVGGSAYYTSLALKALGLKVGVVTKTAACDRTSLIEELEQQEIPVFWHESEWTSCYESYFPNGEDGERELRLLSVAEPFRPQELPAQAARLIHLGSLTETDMPLDFVEAARAAAPLLALDGQGLVRRREGDRVTHVYAQDDPRLALVNILKVDLGEATFLSGESDSLDAILALAKRGPGEVLLTRGARGSLAFCHGRLHYIPAYPPQAMVDPTGCGDTYMAGYFHQRLLTGAAHWSGGILGALLATRKLAHHGPLRQLSTADRQTIQAELEEACDDA